MSKKTHKKIDGTWVEIINVWQKVDGTWKSDVIPKLDVSGTWKECMCYILPIPEVEEVWNE